ncbi:peflin-like [Patiria miniata]|uniref:Peflin n=1 Tax=Patiria miniata TaxID=46514 RepID=A0A914ALM5_PATMI|nr:peflin-like [Patiria miniata]
MGTTLLLQNLFCSGTSSPYQLFYTRASQSTESQLHPWFVNGMYPCTACVLHCSANTTHNYYTTAQTVLSVLVGRFTVKQMSWGGQQPAYNPNYQAHGQRPPMQGYHPSQPPPHQMSYGAPQHGYGAPPPQYNPQQYPAATGQQPGYQQPGYQQPGMPPGADPTLWHWFQAVDADHSGSISATELRQALVNGNWSHFNEETCRLMIGMFDKDRNGTINFSEFAALWKYIQDWKSCFERSVIDFVTIEYKGRMRQLYICTYSIL